MYFAKKIVTSFGGILYGNGIFFNPKAERYYLFTSHPPYYDQHLFRYVNIPLNIDDNIDYFLKSIGEI